ncbi:MAG: hypothetical protein K6B45_04910 [Bacteroidaceae bacterium]|nr:hypothetical protein [Bacteroidaceae bacterium]
MKERKKTLYTLEEAYKDIKKAEKALKLLKKEIRNDTEDNYEKEIKVHIKGLFTPYKKLVERIRVKERWEQYQKRKFEKEMKEWEGIPSMEDS